VQDVTPQDALEWEDVETELCSAAREACAFGADWPLLQNPVAPASGLGTTARDTHGAYVRDRGGGS
jgi:hypothetical protein